MKANYIVGGPLLAEALLLNGCPRSPEQNQEPATPTTQGNAGSMQTEPQTQSSPDTAPSTAAPPTAPAEPQPAESGNSTAQ